MIRILTVVLGVSAALIAPVGPLSAQTETATGEQSGQPDIAAMLEQVESTAAALNERVSSLEGQISESGNSEEMGRKLMADMLTAANDVVQAVDSESPLWQDINELMVIWAADRDRLVEMGESNATLIPLANEWQAKIDEAQQLRTQLIDQAAEGKALVEQIEQQQDLIIELYKLRMADRVLSEMRAMSDELGAMNQTMAAIRDTARDALSDPGAVVLD